MSSLISPKMDIVFKTLFVSHKELLPSFLSAILEVPEDSLSEISIVNGELMPDRATGKYGRLDLNLKLEDQLIDIEMQVCNFPEYRKRCLFYWARQYTAEIRQGEEYYKLKPALAIHILNFNMFQDDRYAREIRLKDVETGERFSSDMGLYFLELPKVDGIRSGSPAKDKKKLWMQFFKAETKEDFEMLQNTQVPEIRSAVRVLLDMSEDAKTRARIAAREAEMHDSATLQRYAKEQGIAQGIAQGKAQGIAQGKEQGKTEAQFGFVRSLLQNGFSLPDALRLAGLDEAAWEAGH